MCASKTAVACLHPTSVYPSQQSFYLLLNPGEVLLVLSLPFCSFVPAQDMLCVPLFLAWVLVAGSLTLLVFLQRLTSCLFPLAVLELNKPSLFLCLPGVYSFSKVAFRPFFSPCSAKADGLMLRWVQTRTLKLQAGVLPECED